MRHGKRGERSLGGIVEHRLEAPHTQIDALASSQIYCHVA